MIFQYTKLSSNEANSNIYFSLTCITCNTIFYRAKIFLKEIVLIINQKLLK